MRRSHKIRLWTQWGTAGWALAITVLSLVPKEHAIQSGASDKLDHLAAYALLSFLAVLGWRKSIRLPVILLVVIAYGALLDGAQMWVPGRNPDWWDVLANSVGGVLGAGLALIANRYLAAR